MYTPPEGLSRLPRLRGCGVPEHARFGPILLSQKGKNRHLSFHCSHTSKDRMCGAPRSRCSRSRCAGDRSFSRGGLRLFERAQRFADFGYHVVGPGTEIGPADVGGGEVQSVKHCPSARQVKIAENDGSQHFAECDLDDFGIFEKGEIVSVLSR
jgi:hypothetical protein